MFATIVSREVTPPMITKNIAQVREYVNSQIQPRAYLNPRGTVENPHSRTLSS